MSVIAVRPPWDASILSSVLALRISYVAFGLAVLSAGAWFGAQALHIPLPLRWRTPVEVVGMTWPLSLYAVAIYRRKLGLK